MHQHPRLTTSGLGISLAFLAAFVILSLAGFDPADAPGQSVDPSNATPQNYCGPMGAALAHHAIRAVGWSVVLPAWALLVAVLGAFLDRPERRWAGTLAGLLVLTGTLATLFQLFAPQLGPSTPLGSGGVLGGLASTLLADHVGKIGTALALLAAALLGFRLAGESLFVTPARDLLGLLGRFGIRRRYAALDAPDPHYGFAAPAMASLAGPEPIDRLGAPPIRTPLGPAGPVRADSPRPPAPISNRSAAALPAYSRPADGGFQNPPVELLDPPAEFAVQEHEALIQQRALILEKALREHGCVVRVVQIDTGPVITMFEVELEAGLRVSKVLGLSSDLAIALAVPSVRIVYPIPGKTTVGIEVPNENRAVVRLGELMALTAEATGRMQAPLFLGRDVKGMPLAFDLAKMPHLLIAGRTGTGKSVCLNSIIVSILMTRRPDEVKLILIDPKKVELSAFRRVPHLMHPVVTDMDKAEALLAWACEKMEERYALLERARVRSIAEYNALGHDELFHRLQVDDEEGEKIPGYLHSIVIVADEMADLVMTASKEVETHIVRLAQKARAAGIHLVLATQRPTVDVITGLIKGNMPARIAFQVTSRNDSRVVLDEMGADKLLGNGDMLFLVPGTSNLIRAQGTYVSDNEINRVTAYLEQFPAEFSKELTKLHLKNGGGKDKPGGGMKDRDDLYEAAVDITLREGKGSTSLLQRALGIGYGRAARLIDYMAEDGIVGVSKGSVARDVLFTWEEWEALKNGGEPAAVDD
ncbi:MAG: DNA translocase FtsK 4TM domain-containing protein [Isosphaeraceae bacterium]